MSDQTPAVADPVDGGLFDGRYRVGPLLGRGGYARVHEAVDTALERSVALKIIEGDGADPSDVVRVRSEIRLLASVSHPSLVTLYDARLAGSPAYLVMELISGPTLSDRIAHGPLPVPEVALIGREIAEAFAVIHARGIVHRDVKPSNILIRPAAHVGETPRATLADFGIAALVGATRVTRADTVIGTAAYLSPEQARGLPAAPSSDVYALGLVLLEALTGTSPFGSRTPHEALAARLVSTPEIPAHLPPAWREVLRRMTALEPGDRPDATDVIVSMRTVAIASAGSVDARTVVLPRATAPTPAHGGSDERTRVLPQSEGDPSSPSADRTRVLSTVGEDRSQGPSASGASPGDARAVAPTPRRGSRKNVVVAVVVSVVLAAGVAIAALSLSGSGVGDRPDLPTLPQPLEQHMDELWTEVGP